MEERRKLQIKGRYTFFYIKFNKKIEIINLSTALIISSINGINITKLSF